MITRIICLRFEAAATIKQIKLELYFIIYIFFGLKKIGTAEKKMKIFL